MTLRLAYHAELWADIRSARDWYEERRPGYGSVLVNEFGHVALTISEFPHAFPEFQADWRRALFVRFPFQIAYSILTNQVLLLGMGHQHEKPENFIDRLARRTLPQ